MQSEEAQNEHHDHDEADQVNDAVHRSGTSYLGKQSRSGLYVSQPFGGITLAKFARFRTGLATLAMLTFSQILKVFETRAPVKSSAPEIDGRLGPK